MEDETNFMEFSVVDECGSDEGDDPDDEIQVLDGIGSSNPSKESDLFADMVVLDISTSPTKELEEVTEKSRSSHRSNRYRDKRSPYRERSSRDKRSSNRESSRKEEEKKSDRRRDRSRSKDRRQDRSRSKESRYKSSSDRRRRSREKEREKSSSSKRSQNTPTKEASKRSQSSKQTEKKDDTNGSTTKSSSKVHSKENQKTVKDKDSKETLEKASAEKPETDGESEGEGISISTDDNIFSGINASDMSKSDFVTLTVVDEDDNEEINTKNIPEKKTTLKTSDSNPAKCKKADVTEKMKTQSPLTTASDDKRKTQQMQKMMKTVNEPASKNAIQEKEKTPLKVTNRLTEIFKTKSDSKKEVEMVVVKDIDKLDKPSPTPRATSISQQRPTKEDPNKFKVTEELFTVENVEDAGTRKPTREDPNKLKVTEEMFSVENVKDTGKRKPTKGDPNKFKVTEELFTVENMDKTNREVKIIGVDDLLLKNADKEESKDSSNKEETSAIKAEESKSVNKAQMVVIEDSAKTILPQKNQGASSPSPGQRKSVREDSSKVNVTEEVLPVESQQKTEQEVSIVNVGSLLEEKEENAMTSEIKDRKSENQEKDNTVKMEDKPREKKPEKETKLFEVPSIDEEEGEEMEISIMDELNVESKSSEISGETDEDVIEVIFSNGEEEEEMLLNSKTEFEDNFSKGTDQADKPFSSKLAQDHESSISISTNRETQAKGIEQIDKNQESAGPGSHDKGKIPSPQTANNEQNVVQEQEFKEIESPVEPDDVIEDGMEIIVLSDTEDEDIYLEHETQYKDEEIIDHNDNEYADMLADNKDKVESTEIENTSRDAEDDMFIEDGTEITIEDEGSEIEAGDEDNLGEIDEDAFLAMMQSEGLTVEDAEDETRENSEQVDEATDSTQLLITVSQTSEKRDVKSSGDSQEQSELKSPIDRISSNLARIRKEMDDASKQSKSGSKEGSSREKDEDRGSRERSKDRGSREPSKDKEGQKSISSERDLRQVLKGKKSQSSRDLRDVIKERKAKEIDDGEPEQCLSEESPLEVDEYFEEEELVEIDTFYDDYQEKKLETVVIVDETLLPKEKEHWGFDTVGEVMRLPMRMSNVSVEDLGRESATFMLEAFNAFFVDLNSGDGALYIDNSELKTMRPFIMIGKIAKFLKECPHVDVECDRAISFLLEEKLKAVGIKKKNQIPKRGLLYIRGIPKHITEEKLANSLKAIEAIIPKNLMDKRIGFAMVVYNTTEEVKKFLATLKIFDKTCISYQEIARKRKGLFRELQEHPEAKEALLDGDTQLLVHKRQVEARKRLMAIQEQIMKKNKEKIKKTRNKKLQKQRERQKEKELRNLMMRAKKIMEEEGLEENLEIITDTIPGKNNKGRSMEEHEQLRSPLKNAELKTATGIVPIEGNVRDADYNRLRREVLEELKDDISNGRFRHQRHLEDAIRKGIESKRNAEARVRLTRWGSGGVEGVVQSSQTGGTGEVYSINQFKEDFRKTRVMVQRVPMPDSSLPNMVPDSIEIMIPVQEGSLPMQSMQGQTQMMPLGSQVLPAPVQMVPRPVISGNQVPISSIPGVSTLASVQQPFPLSQVPQMTMASVQQQYMQSHAPQVAMTSVQQPYLQSQAPQMTNTSVHQAFPQPQAPYIQNFQHHPPRPPVSNYVQSAMTPMPVPSTVGQQVPIMQGMQPGGVAMQPRGIGGTLQRPPTGLPMPGLSQIQSRPGLVGYPGSRLPGAVPHRNIAPGPIPISNPPGTVPRAPVPRAPVPVVNPVTPAIIQSQPVLYKPPTSNAPTAGLTNSTKKPVDNAQNINNSQQEKSNKDDRVSDAQSRSKGRENAPAIKINVGSQFSKKSMQILKRKNEDIDGMPMSEGNSAKKSKTDEVGPKSILKKDEQQGKIDIFETEAGNSKNSGSKTTPSQSSESQFKRKGNLISVPIQKGTVQQQRTTSKPEQQQEVGKKIQVLQNRIAQKFPTGVTKKATAEPPQEDTEQGNVSPQTLSYLRTHQVNQQKTSYSSSESEDDSADFMQRLKGPEGLMSLMDVDVSGVQPSGQGIQDMLKKWDYLAEKQKLQREKEKLARKEAKLKKFMEKAPILMQEYEENERKRQEKKRAQENDPLIKLLQSALEAAQQKANKRRSPSPVLTDNEEEDMSLSEDEEESTASGEFIIDYGHRSLTGQKDKPQKLTRRQRRARRMDQKKAEMEYRKKMESEKGQKSTSEKESRDELTDMLKSSLKAVQDHLDEMKKQKPQSQQEQASQNPFLQDLMSRVHTHIQAQQQGGVNTSIAQTSSQPRVTTSSSLPQKSFTQTPAVGSMEAGSRGPGTSWASQMQPQHGGPVSITPYVPLSSNVSNLPSNTFEYGHSSKSVQPSWGGGYGGDFRGEVTPAAPGQLGEKPVQERTEVFDYGHKSKSETKGNPPASTKDTATASSTQPQSQTDIHSLTIESISEILQVAKTLQASQAKIKDTLGKPNTTGQQQKVTQENLKRNSVGELLKNISQSGSNSSQSNKGLENKSVSGQASSGPIGTRMHFHGSQGKNQNTPNVGHQGNPNNPQSNYAAPQQNREKSESPPVEMFLGMEGSRYERQKQREEEERRKKMEKNSPVRNFGRQQIRGNNSSSLQGMGRGSALPCGRSSSSSFSSGQRNSNQSAFGSSGSHSQQHSHMQNRQGHNNQNRQGQNTTNISSHNKMNRPGKNTMGGLGQNTMNRSGQNTMNRPGHNTMGGLGQNKMNRPEQNMMNRPGQNNMGGLGQNTMNRPGNNAMGGSSQNTMNRPGQNNQVGPGQMQQRPGPPQHHRYPGMSQSPMQSKTEAESITELMTENELQSWENLQRQLRQSYLEDQISGPTMSAYDQRLKQGNQQTASSQNQPKAGSLDWFQQSKQLQMQDRLRRQTAPRGILKGAPTKASKIWAEEDMEFHSTSQQVANWGQGAKPFNQGNKGPNSTLVHYANSDSD